MLFDSTTTWNRQEWGADEVLGTLIENQQVRNTILVAVWNTEDRHSEYFPQKPFESLTKRVQDSLYALQRNEQHSLFNLKIKSDDYLRFLTKELKPYIDAHYSTSKDPEDTFIMGSSMGGLISLYAICEYPEVFGGAACLSTHWPGVFSTDNNPIPDAFFSYMMANLPPASSHKLYFDLGTETLDELYSSYQPIADSIVLLKGYSPENFLTRQFIGHGHDEKSWRNRLHIPLIFLLKEK